jgi:hypothetical protein
MPNMAILATYINHLSTLMEEYIKQINIIFNQKNLKENLTKTK